MSRCVNITPKRRKICAGDMTQIAELQGRNLRGAKLGSNSHTINFTTVVTMRCAIATLKPGTIVFDGSNDRAASHDFFMNYVDFPSVTAENWILYDGREFDILNVENLEEQNRFFRLRCNERGTDSNVVNSQ